MKDENATGTSDKAREWERKWAEPQRVFGWHVRSIPDEIRQAVEHGWFGSGGSVVDIGCGSGDIAAWLAQQGYEVVGVDFAPSAIAKARSAHANVEGVTFDVVDVCRRPLPGGPFDALLDRGCLQGIPSDDRQAYLRHVAAAAKPGAHFLLLVKISFKLTREEVRRDVEALCESAFDVVRVTETVMAHRPDTGKPLPGLSIWLVRHS
jgi:2-polyprenyl-3-methyl-5-hydroxy-6-metoxy-1,4-benzoquinol methylase